MKGSRFAPKLLVPIAVLLMIGLVPLFGTGSEAQTAIHPLDPYPGFGRSETFAVRDDAIALWEAQNREALTSRCMEDAGFVYHPELAFPSQPIPGIAEFMDVQVVPMPAPFDPEEANAEYRASLSASELDAYYQALVGESAADMEAFHADGVPPNGESGDTFATGGCEGISVQRIPSVWDAKRELGDELQRLADEALASPQVQSARTEFAGCTEERTGLALAGPGETEEAMLSVIDEGAPGDPDLIASAFQECIGIWEEGYAAGEAEAAEAFVARNQATLDLQQDEYDNVMDHMHADESFMDWLRIAAGAAAFEQLTNGEIDELHNVHQIVEGELEGVLRDG